ncbi:hypothetical protein DEJ13_17765 (plasmid) [Curtobacterium sp. MCLR17_007]|uniref:hypothetical protein n=1 Tax=Curtobacterium sp. MCLR17_007 TaxID=2175648 RepID=UPI0015E8B93F|nr:hypothetical protein [Curtobacterium sp. MCLR17_007]WIB62120.1 hypothetical protein DEJ13_17765 [Curtobacterium sp. MCLR17_007]
MSIEAVLATPTAHLLANGAATGPRSPILVIGVVVVVVVVIVVTIIRIVTRGGLGRKNK